MTDVVVIYARPDQQRARWLVDALSDCWKVWWDDTLTGRYHVELENRLRSCKCAVSIVTASSRQSDNLLNELEIARDQGATIIPAQMDNSRAPFGFSAWSKVDMKHWNGEADNEGLQQLRRKLATVVPPNSPPARPTALYNGRLPLPALFHSVSSHETRLDPLEAVKVLSLFALGEKEKSERNGAPPVLSSAYDLLDAQDKTSKEKKELRALRQALKQYRRRGGVVVMDSGNYEAERKEDKTWCSDAFHSILKDVPHDFSFAFDYNEPSGAQTRQSRQALASMSSIVKGVKIDRRFTSSPVLPIVHAPRRKSGGYELQDLPVTVRRVAAQLCPPVVAIPERELGPGLIEAARSIRCIRSELDTLPTYQPLHILGTSNPQTVAVYTVAGADSFDGLDWCRYVVDTRSSTLHHIQHYDFFELQSRFADSKVTRTALDDDAISISGKAALHNLDYYAAFAHSLHLAAVNTRLEGMVTKLLGKEKVELLEKRVPEIF